MNSKPSSEYEVIIPDSSERSSLVTFTRSGGSTVAAPETFAKTTRQRRETKAPAIERIRTLLTRSPAPRVILVKAHRGAVGLPSLFRNEGVSASGKNRGRLLVRLRRPHQVRDRLRNR